MVRLSALMVIVGVLVTLAAKMVFVLTVFDVKAEKQERELETSIAGFIGVENVSEVAPVNYQMSPLLSILPEVRMLLLVFAVEEPLKIQRVWLVRLSWLG